MSGSGRKRGDVSAAMRARLRLYPSKGQGTISAHGAAELFCAPRRARFFPSQGEVPPAPPNRGISAEMQCGTASRAARDLPARRGMEPCSPVNSFFLDGGFWLGEGASRALGGVPGRIPASGRQKSFRAPAIFLWYRQAAPSLCSPLRAAQKRRGGCAAEKRWWGRPFPQAKLAKKPRPRPRRESLVRCAESLPSAGKPRFPAVLG